MENMRLACLKELPIQKQRAESAMISLQQTLDSLKHKSESTAVNQVKLHELKNYLRELEDDLAHLVSAKTSREVSHVALVESLSAAKATTEELEKHVQDKKARKNEYEAIMFQQVLSVEILEETSNQDIIHRKGLEEAISWYNRVLGFRIEPGLGLKFIFCKIDLTNPDKEYFFTIRHSRDTYTLLDCDPYLEDTKELVEELNRTNGLFKFVRVMREKFQLAATVGQKAAVAAGRLLVGPDEISHGSYAPVSSASQS